MALLAFADIFGIMSYTKTDNTTAEDLTNYVEPRIGTTHCRYFHMALGVLPFGMAKPGSSTNGHYGNKSGWGVTGYSYRDTSIEEFSCLHGFQIGGIMLMSTVGKLFTVPGDTAMTDGRKGYRSRFSHDDEVAMAGYYSVLLKGCNVTAEMTAITRVVFQRYAFPASKENRILFDIDNRQGESDVVKNTSVQVKGSGIIVEGQVITLSEYVKKYQPGAEVPPYFHAVVDKKPVGIGTFSGETVKADSLSTTGLSAGACLTFETTDQGKITVKVGVSYTSVESAQKNLEAEAQGLAFDEAKEQSHEVWSERLSRITVETTNKDDKMRFYTGLYHAILGRGAASDISGAYSKHDGTADQTEMKDGKPAFNLYNTDAMWGAQWNLNRAWIMACPEHMSDSISSYLQVYKNSGWLDDGLASSRHVSGIETSQLSLMIAVAYACGIRDFDVNLTYEACRKNELDGENRPLGAGKADTKLFVGYGYVSRQGTGEGSDEMFMSSTSHTLEYAFGAWATAQMAKTLGKTDDYKKLMDLSKGWEHIYDTSANFVCLKKADGSFIENFGPIQVWHGFQEGNTWQYTFYAPHDTKALVAKMGTEEFNNRLDSIFTRSQGLIFSGGTEVGAFTGLKMLCNQGSQPCLHTSWMFSEAGKPPHTRKWMRAILDEFYGTDGIHGYDYGQDEGQGQLGAWLVQSSIGMFDVKGLTTEQPSFGLGGPLLDKITIRLNKGYYKGDKFVINVSNNSEEDIYIREYRLNGKTLDSTYLPFAAFTEGDTLGVIMGDTPKDKY